MLRFVEHDIVQITASQDQEQNQVGSIVLFQGCFQTTCRQNHTISGVNKQLLVTNNLTAIGQSIDS